jgi:hypothetical protein
VVFEFRGYLILRVVRGFQHGPMLNDGHTSMSTA